MRRPEGFEPLDVPTEAEPHPDDARERRGDVLALDAVRRRRAAAAAHRPTAEHRPVAEHRPMSGHRPDAGHGPDAAHSPAGHPRRDTGHTAEPRRWALSAYADLDEPDIAAAGPTGAGDGPAAPGAPGSVLEQGGSNAQRVDRAWREAEREQRRVEREEGKAVRQAARAARRARRRREMAEVRRFTAARRRQLRIAGLTVGGMVAALALLVGLVWSPLMSVRDVRVEGAERLDPALVQQALAGSMGEPIATVTEQGVAASLQAIPQIESFRLDVVPPSTVIVRIVERLPAAIVPSESGESVIDAAGVVLGGVDGSTGALPRLDGVEIGGDSFEAVASVLVAAPPSVLEATASIAAPSPSDIRLSLHSGQTVLWGGADESQLKADVVAALLETQDPALAVVLDVRAPQHPVVRGA